MGWEVYPDGLTDLLVRLHDEYELPPLYITENGAAFPDDRANGSVPDAQRVSYLERHLDALADAVERGVPVRGYFVWSLLDNFEWAFGYTRGSASSTSTSRRSNGCPRRATTGTATSSPRSEARRPPCASERIRQHRSRIRLSWR